MSRMFRKAAGQRFASAHKTPKKPSWAQIKAKKPRFKHPNKKARVLCRHDGYIFYDDGTWRVGYNTEDTKDLSQWEIVPFPKTGHNMFFYRDSEEDEWITDYASFDEQEIALGEAVARALANNEVKKMLTGQYDEPKESDKIEG